METALHVGLGNALAAALLALAAAAGTYLFRRRPALVHGLWLLVLLKLVTPPLLWIPVPLLPAAPAGPAAEAEPVVAAPYYEAFWPPPDPAEEGEAEPEPAGERGAVPVVR